MNRKREKILAEARSWIGTPYGPGANKGISASCVGFVAGVGRNCGYKDEFKIAEPYLGRLTPQKRRQIYIMCKQIMEQIHPNNAQPGDIFLFVDKANFDRHMGILTKPDHMIHADNRRGLKKVVEIPIPSDWRLFAVFRAKGVDE